MKNTLMLVLITIAIMGFVVFWDTGPELLMGKETTKLVALPVADSYMVETKTRKFDRQGRESFLLLSTGSLYFQREDRLQMDAPRVWALQGPPGTPPWRIVANSSEVFGGGERVVLQDNVHAWRDLDATGNGRKGREELKTSRLTLFPDQHLAETDQAVTLITPDQHTTAVGLKANFERERYHLLAQVKSIHHAR
ncbi:MAG: LPS export ABC transporter periplasmic protein LptC [Porticoccaceae bacterium]